MWSRLDCSHACFAGGGDASLRGVIANETGTFHERFPLVHVGECAWTTWLHALLPNRSITWLRMKRASRPELLKEYNHTHAMTLNGPISYGDVLRTFGADPLTRPCRATTDGTRPHRPKGVYLVHALVKEKLAQLG